MVRKLIVNGLGSQLTSRDRHFAAFTHPLPLQGGESQGTIPPLVPLLGGVRGGFSFFSSLEFLPSPA